MRQRNTLGSNYVLHIERSAEHIENAGEIGIPLPKKLKQAIEVLKE